MTATNVAATATCVLTAGTGTTVLAVPTADTIICTTAAAIVPGTVGTTAAAVTTFTFIAGAVTTGAPQAALKFNVATSTDQQLAATLDTVALGAIVPDGGLITIDALDRIPNQVNTKAITVSFTSVTAVPTAGKITVTVPRAYFAKVDESKANTLTTSATPTATCALVQATAVETKDSIICTTSAVLAGGSIVLTFAAGTITTGGAVAALATSANVATSVDKPMAALASMTVLGGQLSAGVDMAFTNSDDKVPGKFTSNNATITLGFTVITAIPIGGKITITLPQRYFTAVDGTKDNTVGASATAKCALANVAQTTVPAAIALSASTVTTSTTLTVSFVPSIVSGVTQVAIPLVGFSLDSTLSVACAQRTSLLSKRSITMNQSHQVAN